MNPSMDILKKKSTTINLYINHWYVVAVVPSVLEQVDSREKPSSTLPFQLSWKRAENFVLLASPVDSWSSLLFARVPPEGMGSEKRPLVRRGSCQQMPGHYKFHVKLKFIVPRLCTKPTTILQQEHRRLSPLFITWFSNAVLHPSLVIYIQCHYRNCAVNSTSTR
jgi:hypothetical protein